VGKSISKKKNVREEILLVASRAFNYKNYNSTSIKEIADEMGIDHSTIYHYFKNKMEIFIEIVERFLKLTEEGVEGLEKLPLSPAAKLYLYIFRTGQVYLSIEWKPTSILSEPIYEQPELYWMWERYQIVWEILRKILKEGSQSGQFIEMDQEVFSYHAASSIEVLVWMAAEEEEVLKKVAIYTVRSVINDTHEMESVLAEVEPYL